MKSYQITAFGQPLEECNRTGSAPTGTEVVVRVLATGVCHSDLYLHKGYYELGGGKRLAVTDRGVKLPVTPGHEICGEVVALGPHAQNVSLGDVRLIYPWTGCGACPACQRDTENLCRVPNYIGIHRPGGYAEQVVVPHPRYLIEIDPLSPQQAAPYACSGLTAYSALKKLGTLLHDAPVAIIGAGGVGLMAVGLVKALGGFGAIAVDISAEKRSAALQAGAIAAVDSKSPEALAQISAAAPDGLLAVIDFVGATQTADLGLAALARGGRYIIVGFYGGDLHISLPFLPMRALTIQGSYTGSLDELNELMVFARRGVIGDLPIQSEAMSCVNDVLKRLDEGQILGRTVIIPG